MKPILALVTLVLAAATRATGTPSPTANQLFMAYLDNWVKLFNETLHSVPSAAISVKCTLHIEQVLTGVTNNELWAIKMLDAIGKPTSGIMEAHLSFLGSYSECIETRATATTEQPSTTDSSSSPSSSSSSSSSFSGKYCMAHVQLPNAALSALQKLSGLSPSVLTSAYPRIGLCLPSTCDQEEIQLLARTALSLVIENSTLSISNCYEQESSGFEHDTAAHTVLGLFALILIPILIGTTYDMFRPTRSSNFNQNVSANNNYREFSSSLKTLQRARTPTGSVASLVTTTSRTSSKAGSSLVSSLCVRQILVAFSVKRNADKILNTEDNPSSIGVLHGLRVLMMLWIIGGHSYSFAMQWLFFQNPNKMKAAPKNVVSQIIANGTFSVDSFFFISGLLVSLVGLRMMRRTKGKFNFVYFYVHRYLRMTPLMMVIIGFSATLLRYAGDGPGWHESITVYDSWCRDNWWLNVFYMHNFVNRSNMCLSHSWYSAVDMQLYLIAPIIIIALYKKPKIGFTILGAILVGSMAITAFLTFTRHFPAVPYINDLVPQDIVNDYYGAIYIKPYTRVGPYLVGMAFGFLLYTLDGNVHLTTTQSRIGWTAAITLNLAILFSMAPANMGYLPSDAMAALYSSTSRTLWATTLAWVTYACLAGRGGVINSFLSWKVWVPLSRLTYSAYLIHPIVMVSFYGSRQTTFEFSHFLMLYLTLGHLVLTYALSFILSTLIESPIVALEKIFLAKLITKHR
ncbi:Nose resistant to fluoxetine protein 6 [Halotydeus destructor]|nr:Nose resistant to fluoxetine protein 6 [Halotydeus destructor]